MPRLDEHPDVKAQQAAKVSAQMEAVRTAFRSLQQQLYQDLNSALSSLRAAGVPGATLDRIENDSSAAFQATREALDALTRSDLSNAAADQALDLFRDAAEGLPFTIQAEEAAQEARRIAETPLDTAAPDEDFALQKNARDAALQELRVYDAASALLDAAEIVRGAVREADACGNGVRPPPDQVRQELQREYAALAGEIAPYDELSRRTQEFNRKVGENLSRRSLEYVGLRLDAEHFIDKRFFKPFEAEWKRIGIESEDKMPTFAVHTEYHLRKLENLSEKAGIPEAQTLHGASLTQEKLDQVPLDKDKPRERYRNLLSVLEAFEEFWKKKATVDSEKKATVDSEKKATVDSEKKVPADPEKKPPSIENSYWKRLESEFARLKKLARDNNL